jgi:CheY-like chemotaxis protein
LLSNAFKYTPDNGKILVSIYLENGMLRISVSNTGKGIDKEDIPFVFDRYRVLENFEKQTQKGFFSRNGLGLAICHNMVRLLDGDIRIESVPGQSTQFHVTLPGKDVTPASPVFHEDLSKQTLTVPLKKNDAIKTSKPEHIKLTVFIIDDDPEMCWFISEFMSEKYNVVTIENPLSVRNVLETVQPQLIISDIMMPGIDGISPMKQIKSDRKTAHIPFILLSAKSTPEEQTEGAETKPMEVNVRITALTPDNGNQLATATINLNSSFALVGVKVMEGENGRFVRTPSYKSGDEYKEHYFPTTKEFREQLHGAVLTAYDGAIAQAEELAVQEYADTSAFTQSM